jgi:hypothetical protein
MEDEQGCRKFFMNRQEERESEGGGESGVLTAGGAEHGSRWCFLLPARGSLQRTAKEGKTTGGGGALLRRQTRKKQRAWRRRDAVWLCVCLSMSGGPFSMI